MPECRYKPSSQLQPLASPDQIQCILRAIRREEIRVIGLALRYVEQVWHLDVPRFIAALHAHLLAERRVFLKSVPNPRPGITLLDANVGLFPDGDDEDEDVYVEIRIQGSVVVIIGDAHNHERGIPRLPK